ncbi:MAG: 2OG-Fe(II) oxygenase, partial [Pseudonocardiaceae bacterium]
MIRKKDASWADRVNVVDWDSVSTELERYGCALTGPLLSPDEAAQIAALYPEDSRFRSTVNMGRHRFGEGEYRYFAEPFPDAVVALKQ